MIRSLVFFVLVACTTSQPAAMMPGRSYGELWGALGAETCATLAETVCSGSSACEQGYEFACAPRADVLVAAPSREVWERNWKACREQIAADSFGFECGEFLP